MTLENHNALEEPRETVPDTLEQHKQEHTEHYAVEVDPQEMKNLEESELDIKYRLSETADAIRDAQAKKGKEVERWDTGTSYIATQQPKTHNGLRNKFMAGLIGVASVLGFSSKAKAGGTPENSSKKPETEKILPSDSVESEKPFDPKKYEQFGIYHVERLETTDSTKEVLLVSIPEYKSYGDVFATLKKAGLTPASTETMNKAMAMNEAIFKKAGAVISLDEIVDKLGNPSYNTVTWDKKTNSFHGESREIQVMKTDRKESLSNFDSDYDRYSFIVELPKTTIDYSSGIVKSK